MKKDVLIVDSGSYLGFFKDFCRSHVVCGSRRIDKRGNLHFDLVSCLSKPSLDSLPFHTEIGIRSLLNRIGYDGFEVFLDSESGDYKIILWKL